MIALLLAALLAAADASVAPMPVGSPTPSPADVVIENSGSTNTMGYRLVVHPDASVDVRQAGETVRKTLSKSTFDGLMATLKAAGPLGSMVAGHCMRSASFGSITRVTYAGQTSADLGCTQSPAGPDLAAAVNAVTGSLGIQRFASARRRPLVAPSIVQP